MKRNLLGLVFLLCCSFAMGQVSAFTSFLQKFKEVKEVKDMGLAAFGDAIISPDLDYASFHPYLSELRPESCAPEKCLWQSGSYVRKGSFDVLQYELLKPEMLYGYQDLTYKVCRRRFVIRGNRKICVRQVEDYSQTVPHPGLTSNPPLGFEGFLRYFKRWDGGTDAGVLKDFLKRHVE